MVVLSADNSAGDLVLVCLKILFSKKFHDDVDQDGDQNAEQNAGHERKVEREVFAFDVNVTWKIAEPGDFSCQQKKQAHYN